MDWVVTRVGVAGLVVAVGTLAAAVVVYATRPRRLQNRLLAVLLGVLGLAVLAGSGLMYLTADPRETYAWQAVNVVFFMAYLWLYPAFLSTLATPLARPLARVRPAFVALAVVTPGLWFLAPRGFVSGIQRGAFAPWDMVPGPAFPLLMLASMGVGLLGLALAVSAYRRADRGSLHRAQARAYLLAFGALDGSIVAFVILSLLSRAWMEGVLFLHLAGIAAFVLLLAYGVLKTQLFDIDLRLKRGIRRGAVAGTLALAFVVANEVTELVLPVDGTLPGVAAASALAFAFRPMERWATRLADRLMPRVQATDAYVAVRKHAVYRAALEEVLADGVPSERERRVLERLSAQLALTDEDAERLEAEVAGAEPPRAPAEVPRV